MKGWTVSTIGDDIAWLKPDANGRLRAINPEAGMFGVAPGTSHKTNPNAMATIARNTIFTNVALTPEGGVWWEGMTDDAARRVPRLAGQAAGRRRSPARPAPRPRIRTPASPRPISQCPIIDPGLQRPARRADQRDHLRRAPRHHHAARLPGIQLDVRRLHGRDDGVGDDSGGGRQRSARSGAIRWRCCRSAATTWPTTSGTGSPCSASLSETPKIFHVNWFRKDADGKFLWPGFSDNMRVLRGSWTGSAAACPTRESPWAGCRATRTSTGVACAFPSRPFEQLQTVDPAQWRREVMEHEELFLQLHAHLPNEMIYERELLICRL